MINQSLEVLNDVFFPDYGWKISHVNMFDSEDGMWGINATAEGDHTLGDFDPKDIESLTHFLGEDILKLRLNADPDAVMNQAQDRASAET